MTEEDPVFDPTMKKKKKKKKLPFDPESLGLAADEQPTEEPKADDDAENQKDDVPEITDEFDGDFSNLKKKKKKKKPFDMSDIDNAVPSKDEPAVEEEQMEESQQLDDDHLNFELPMKKKKRKTKSIKFADNAVVEDKDDSESVNVTSQSSTWHADTDRDYTYDELLTRVFDIMREKNPELVAGEKKRFVMKPPQVSKAGAKKTAFANFAEICKMLHRQPKHLLAFLLAELGTSGSVDGSNSLIIKGRFHQKQIETVLRRYIKEYVTCHTCKSPETILQRDTRLYFLQCETCGSRCSVASIKSGFQAVTGKRAALRAKTT